MVREKKRAKVEEQAALFDERRTVTDVRRLVLLALGEFQARGKELTNRQLPLDRLRGAMRRAAQVMNVEELSDESFAQALESLGANVQRVPPFVAKHPFRITVGFELAEQAREAFATADAN